jgi:DNA-binding NarL/FixJ family response regulator
MLRILVIEDDAETRRNLTTILELEGFDPLMAPDGRSGLALAERERPDLILCDVSMPQMDGYEVLRSLRANRSTVKIPFIFLTALADRRDQRTGMDLGADDYLCKPTRREELLSAINARLLRSRQNLQESQPAPDFSSAVPLESLGLTPREAEVLLWVAQGKANGDIAMILGMSQKTVKIHLGHILEKLAVENRTAAALRAVEALTKAGPA